MWFPSHRSSSSFSGFSVSLQISYFFIVKDFIFKFEIKNVIRSTLLGAVHMARAIGRHSANPVLYPTQSIRQCDRKGTVSVNAKIVFLMSIVICRVHKTFGEDKLAVGECCSAIWWSAELEREVYVLFYTIGAKK